MGCSDTRISAHAAAIRALMSAILSLIVISDNLPFQCYSGDGFCFSRKLKIYHTN